MFIEVSYLLAERCDGLGRRLIPCLLNNLSVDWTTGFWYIKEFPEPLEEKQAHSLTDPLLHPTMGMKFFPTHSSVSHQTHLDCLLLKGSRAVWSALNGPQFVSSGR
ncbi:hypothetical protein CHARACLAT_022942 [Characodon lateralis]|uniref:Uncharacterized protein n=1 Tax=Characodon lateralis TaxID=208331 RepID=A0ABU7EC36_9TELE|nr:hypothetical protein [Characodon lateralis]